MSDKPKKGEIIKVDPHKTGITKAEPPGKRGRLILGGDFSLAKKTEGKGPDAFAHEGLARSIPKPNFNAHLIYSIDRTGSFTRDGASDRYAQTIANHSLAIEQRLATEASHVNVVQHLMAFGDPDSCPQEDDIIWVTSSTNATGIKQALPLLPNYFGGYGDKECSYDAIKLALNANGIKEGEPVFLILFTDEPGKTQFPRTVTPQSLQTQMLNQGVIFYVACPKRESHMQRWARLCKGAWASVPRDPDPATFEKFFGGILQNILDITETLTVAFQDGQTYQQAYQALPPGEEIDIAGYLK